MDLELAASGTIVLSSEVDVMVVVMMAGVVDVVICSVVVAQVNEDDGDHEEVMQSSPTPGHAAGQAVTTKTRRMIDLSPRKSRE